MKPIQYSYARDILMEGYPGDTCRISPEAFKTPDGHMHILYRHLLLSGSDVFMGSSVISSADGGRTFGKPQPLDPLPDSFENGIRTTHSMAPRYHAASNSMYAVGRVTRYANDKEPIVVGEDKMPALIGDFDWKAMRYTGCSRLDIDTPVMRQYAAVTFMEPLDEPDGTILIPAYCSGAFTTRSQVVVIRFKMENGKLVYVENGRPVIRNELKRGVGEPRIARLGNKYYMTLRSDEIGWMAESDDGLNYSEPTVWKWDDGEILTSRNTQQAWLMHPDGLFLVYTRETPHNQHVFRRRAPLFMARFDEDRNCLVKDTEIIAVPEMGARLGNFTVVNMKENEAWICVCEWMQTDPKVCESYGANNRLWRVHVMW